MQFVVVSATQALIVDKAERNSFQISGHSAWSALYNLNTNTVRPVSLVTNSFCAGGSFISNGTLINVGGNPVVDSDLGDENGEQGLRLFTPSTCSDTATSCAFFESPDRIRLGTVRWYSSSVRIDDGSILIIGGATSGGFIDSSGATAASLEFYPPKSINGFNGTAIPSKFLVAALNANLFPIAMLLPDGTVFMASNSKTMTYNWRTNVETRLPDLPNGVRVSYPMAGTGVLLPLTPANNYTPTVLICGGSNASDTANPSTLSSQDPTSAQCVRMDLTTAGIAGGWVVETMPVPRIMPDAIMLPTGEVFIVNGAKTGYSGYGNVKNEVGQSNADNPAFTPVLYNASAALGARFSSSGLPTSTIARLYHSVASLAPSGAIIVAGSNPNADVSTTKYATEYRLEVFSPPYMTLPRPTFSGTPTLVGYGQQFALNVTLPAGTAAVTVSLMDLGYSTHAVHMGLRLVGLVNTLSKTTLTVTGPPNAMIYPPGPAFLYVLADGVPSTGVQVMVGTGASPPVNLGAIANLLATTKNPV
jgi:hypothetical protein